MGWMPSAEVVVTIARCDSPPALPVFCRAKIRQLPDLKIVPVVSCVSHSFFQKYFDLMGVRCDLMDLRLPQGQGTPTPMSARTSCAPLAFPIWPALSRLALGEADRLAPVRKYPAGTAEHTRLALLPDVGPDALPPAELIPRHMSHITSILFFSKPPETAGNHRMDAVNRRTPSRRPASFAE